MSTIAHRLARALPTSVTSRARPTWHRAQLYWRFFRKGGRIRWNPDLLCFLATKPLPGTGRGQRMEVCIRSPRELRRWIAYGEAGTDKVYDWLNELSGNAVLWDIGSSNGLEGFQAALAHNCSVVFVEPFTPSIESMLKTKFANNHRFDRKQQIEIIQAACSDADSIGRLVMHGRPIAGETTNSSADNLDEYCAGGRETLDEESAQWLAFTTLDTLLACDLPAPSHLKVDVDGLERRVLEGAEKLLASPSLVSAAIEVNDENRELIDRMMEGHGFTRHETYVHIDSGVRYTADHFYTRNPTWSQRNPSSASLM